MKKLFCLSALFMAAIASAQSLPTVDTYNDMYSDATNIYLSSTMQVGSWSAGGGGPTHTYAQYPVITSPSGRTASCVSDVRWPADESYDEGCDTDIAFDGELSDWILSGSESAVCSERGTFYSVSSWLPSGVGLSGATFANYSGPGVPPGTCEYELDCGTSNPTCPNNSGSAAINNTYLPCDNYWIQQYYSFIFDGGTRICFKLPNGVLGFPYVTGKSSVAPNPACT
jgi:hypothetical protein